ncbi:type II toxin-antitoxin system RelE/ParE family toxin [Wolbachia endosymbiont (group B) of Germaria angustata]|uniref:type II toxin-antitoxin system RelE family toxin n=1 Tax=Wolbachia endosymbiont (group B) of Germaria angustata TaxID=3077916 RepID=UPI003132FB22
MEYTIIFLDSVLEKDLPSLPKKVRSRAVDAINERLTVDPVNLGEPLYHSFKGFRRLRVGDYRIMYCADTTKYEVTIVTIGHRDTIYEKALKVLKNYVFQ